MLPELENQDPHLSAAADSGAAAVAAPAMAAAAAVATQPGSGTSANPSDHSPADVQAALPEPEPSEPASSEPAPVTQNEIAPAPPVETASSAVAESGSSASAPPEHAESAETAESNEQMEQLIEQYSEPQAAPTEGETIEGHVVAVNEHGVVVDFGAKSEGLVPAQEFVEFGGIPFQPGQMIEVERTHEHKDGYVLLSHVRARRRRVWENIEKSYRDHTSITGRAVDRIKGGLVVDIGLRAFLPASQLDVRPTHDLDSWKGKEITCRVLKVNRKRGNVVVSRRAILEEELKAQREALLATITEGAVATGKVKNVTDYGVFVDLGGLDGLLHISDLVWGRVKHPSEVVKPGDDIQVKVLKFDREKMRISLGRKQLLEDPWATVPERFAVGTRLRGKVVGVTDYGAFVQLEPGVEGLVHVSEMSWSKRMKHPSKIVNVGDEVDVVVLEVKPDQHRISLGLKQTSPDPWQDVVDKYPAGTIISGRVRNMTDFGAFVEIEEGVEGLIHISDMSWTERVKHPSEKFKKGDTVEAKVLKVDAEHRRLSLGIKQLNDIWANWFQSHKLNDVVRGKVARAADFGVFIELAEGIEGLCHISEIEDRKHKGDRQQQNQPRGGAGKAPGSKLEPGQEYDFKVIRLDQDQHKISLSYRAAVKQVERRDMEEYRSSKSSPNATIGDAIMAKRGTS